MLIRIWVDEADEAPDFLINTRKEWGGASWGFCYEGDVSPNLKNQLQKDFEVTDVTHVVTAVLSGGEEVYRNCCDLDEALAFIQDLHGAIVFLETTEGEKLCPSTGSLLGKAKKGYVHDSRDTEAFQQLLQQGYTPTI